MRKSKVVVAVSGGFDPIHIGHIRHFRAAKELGDRLIVILNSDDFLKRKRGYVFMPFSERKEIIQELECVDEVFDCIDQDDTVADSLALVKPDIFAKGGDRNISNIPKREKDICKTFGIKVVSDVGGDKIQPSSWLIENLKNKIC